MNSLQERWKSRSLPTNITDAPDIPWTSIGPGKDHLVEELEKLYWEGTKDELENVIRTLRCWNQQKYPGFGTSDEQDGHIYGYDTFLDQVNQHTRAYAIGHG